MLNLPTPRKWQSTALAAWVGKKKGIAKVVTGGGKTAFAGMCISNFVDANNRAVVIVVPTTALRDQWYATMTANWGVKPEKIVTDKTKIASTDWHFLLLVINTARENITAVQSKGNKMLVVDECHRAGSTVNRKSMLGEWGATLGLSATPERQYDDFFESILVPSLGPIIIDYNYSQAAKDGVIAKFKLSNHLVQFTDDEQNDYSAYTKKISVEYSKLKKEGLNSSTKLERLLMKRASISKNAEFRLPVAVALVENVLPRKTILFHESINHIEALAIVLQDMGVDCRTYHSKMSEVRRVESLSLFISGSIELLLTCRALDEGFDLPDIEVGIIASMTKSPRQRIQRLGRILRHLDGKVAEIKTIHTIHEEGLLSSEAEEMNEALEIKWFG